MSSLREHRYAFADASLCSSMTAKAMPQEPRPKDLKTFGSSIKYLTQPYSQLEGIRKVYGAVATVNISAILKRIGFSQSLKLTL